jgi:hypothetical protein
MQTTSGLRFVECDRLRSSCLLQIQSFNHPTPALANASRRTFGAHPPSIIAHNGSAQLSYFIYSCTVRTQPHRHTTACRHHARVNLRPNVLCIRSTMSNSQRTSLEGQSRRSSLLIFLLSREVTKRQRANPQLVARNWWSRTGSNR